jgi:hypothetical protein
VCGVTHIYVIRPVGWAGVSARASFGRLRANEFFIGTRETVLLFSVVGIYSCKSLCLMMFINLGFMLDGIFGFD